MFYYKVKCYDEIDYKETNESGIVAAKDYNEAMSKIDEYYGIQNIVSVYIEEWEDILTEDNVMIGFNKCDVEE